MTSAYKPDGHKAVSPYLLLADVPGMLDFLAAAFGAVERCRIQAPDGSIKHAETQIDDSVVMMGERPAGVACSTHVYVPDVDDTYRKAMAAGATSVAEPRDLPYGDRSAGFRDPQGNLWWVGTHLGKPPGPA
ncbi:MAG: VOC family protein [Rhodanobacter sp.]